MGTWLNANNADPQPEVFDQRKSAGLDVFTFETPFPMDNKWALSLGPWVIKQEAEKQWQSGKIPHSFSGGDVVINEPTYYFDDLDGDVFHKRDDRMYTMIRGTYTIALPDVSFFAVVTDVFKVENDKLNIYSSHSLDVDTSILNYLTGIFLGLAAVVGSISGGWVALPLFLAAGFFGAEDAIAHLVDRNFPSPAKEIVDKFFPGSLEPDMTGLPVEIPLAYKGFKVNEAIMSATGTW